MTPSSRTNSKRKKDANLRPVSFSGFSSEDEEGDIDPLSPGSPHTPTNPTRQHGLDLVPDSGGEGDDDEQWYPVSPARHAVQVPCDQKNGAGWHCHQLQFTDELLEMIAAIRNGGGDYHGTPQNSWGLNGRDHARARKPSKSDEPALDGIALDDMP